MSNAKKILAVILISSAFVYADVKLPAIFGDHMVLQQKRNVPIWGWAEPGGKITVKAGWQNQPAVATAGKDNKWMVIIWL